MLAGNLGMPIDSTQVNHVNHLSDLTLGNYPFFNAQIDKFQYYSMRARTFFTFHGPLSENHLSTFNDVPLIQWKG